MVLRKDQIALFQVFNRGLPAVASQYLCSRSKTDGQTGVCNTWCAARIRDGVSDGGINWPVCNKANHTVGEAQKPLRRKSVYINCVACDRVRKRIGVLRLTRSRQVKQAARGGRRLSANSKKTGIAVFKIGIIIVDNDFLTVQGAECNGPTNTCISKDRIGKQRPRPRIRGDATKREKKHFIGSHDATLHLIRRGKRFDGRYLLQSTTAFRFVHAHTSYGLCLKTQLSVKSSGEQM